MNHDDFDDPVRYMRELGKTLMRGFTSFVEEAARAECIDAALALLQNATSILIDQKVRFVVVGYRICPEVARGAFSFCGNVCRKQSQAVTVKKRQRDAFDVFISVAGEEKETFAARWKELSVDGLFRDANTLLNPNRLLSFH